MAKFVVVGDLVNHINYDNCTPCSPPLREVGKRERKVAPGVTMKFYSNYLDAVAHICNCLEYGHDKLKKVVMQSWREAKCEGELSDLASIEISRPGERYSGVEIKVNIGKLPHLYGKDIAKYVAQKYLSGTLIDYAQTENGFVLRDNLSMKELAVHGEPRNFPYLGYMTQEIEVIDNPAVCREQKATLIIKTRSKQAGYLVRDVLDVLNIKVTPTDQVHVKDERTFGDRLSNLILGAMGIALGVPIDWLDRKIEKYAGRSLFEDAE